MENKDFRIKFWGVRGSRPIPGQHTLKYGGNTPCVQVQVGEKLIIFDAGTGICDLGNKLMEESKKVTGHIFFSHVHWDHIQGFPFFLPAFVKGNYFSLYGETKKGMGFREQLSAIMKEPFFPITLDSMNGQIEVVDIAPGQSIRLTRDIIVKTERNNHPNGCMAYRLEYDNRSCCYVTDTEHYEDHIDPLLVKFVNNADVVIYDANYTDEEYHGLKESPAKKGWGHSTWQEGIKLVKAAGAKKLVLFHHSSGRTDKEQDEVCAKAREVYAHCVCAREGLEIDIKK